LHFDDGLVNPIERVKMLTTAVYYANEMLDGYSAFTLIKDQSKLLGLNILFIIDNSLLANRPKTLRPPPTPLAFKIKMHRILFKIFFSEIESVPTQGMH
jgi:hypothetical protein